MSIEKCEHCDLRSQKSNELTRRIEICSIRLERERRIKFRLNRFIVHDHCKKTRKKRRTIISISMKRKHSFRQMKISMILKMRSRMK